MGGIFQFFAGNAAPCRVAQRTYARMRVTWVRKIMARLGTEVVIVQTLRNSLMAASFMAFTSMPVFSTASGVRAFCFRFPIDVSLFNAWLMMPTTVFLVFLLYQFDRIPFVSPDARVDVNPKSHQGEKQETDSTEGFGA